MDKESVNIQKIHFTDKITARNYTACFLIVKYQDEKYFVRRFRPMSILNTGGIFHDFSGLDYSKCSKNRCLEKEALRAHGFNPKNINNYTFETEELDLEIWKKVPEVYQILENLDTIKIQLDGPH